MAVKKYEEKERRGAIPSTGQKPLWIHFQSKSTVRCLFPKEEFACSTDLRGIIYCFLRFLFPVENTLLLCWTHILNYKPCTVKKKICIYAINLLCLVLHHPYPQMELTKGFIISYVQYFAYLYLMFYYVHVCTFKVTIHSNIHGKH